MNAASTTPRKRVALVCTNFTMQSAFGLLIIALNSARLGFETIIYFTFEGLNMIRPGHLERLRYYPTGVDPSEPEVARYTTELRDKMDQKDIPFIEDMLQMARCQALGLQDKCRLVRSRQGRLLGGGGDHARQRLLEAGDRLGLAPDVLNNRPPRGWGSLASSVASLRIGAGSLARRMTV